MEEYDYRATYVVGGRASVAAVIRPKGFPTESKDSSWGAVPEVSGYGYTRKKRRGIMRKAITLILAVGVCVALFAVAPAPGVSKVNLDNLKTEIGGTCYDYCCAWGFISWVGPFA